MTLPGLSADLTPDSRVIVCFSRDNRDKHSNAVGGFSE